MGDVKRQMLVQTHNKKIVYKPSNMAAIADLTGDVTKLSQIPEWNKSGYLCIYIYPSTVFLHY